MAFSLFHIALDWDHSLIVLAFTTLSCIASFLITGFCNWIEFVPFAIEFIGFAIYFVPFAIEFVGFAIEFVGFAVELVGFAIEFVAFALQFVINKMAPRNQPFIKR